MLESAIARCERFPKSANAWMDVLIARQASSAPSCPPSSARSGTACMSAAAGKAPESLRDPQDAL